MKMHNFVLTTLFLILIFWVLIRVFINSQIIDNPLSKNKVKDYLAIKNVNGVLYDPYLQTNKCPYCCQDKSGLIKFRATTPCSQIINDQCSGLNEAACKINKNLCYFQNGNCNYINKNPYQNIKCDESLSNFNCAYAVGKYF